MKAQNIFDFRYRRHKPHKLRKPFLVHLVQESELILACQADVAVNGVALPAKHTAVVWSQLREILSCVFMSVVAKLEDALGVGRTGIDVEKDGECDLLAFLVALFRTSKVVASCCAHDVIRVTVKEIAR